MFGLTIKSMQDRILLKNNCLFNPIVLEWKTIIKQLNHLKTVPTISGYEKIMIEDFL